MTPDAPREITVEEINDLEEWFDVCGLYTEARIELVKGVCAAARRALSQAGGERPFKYEVVSEVGNVVALTYTRFTADCLVAGLTESSHSGSWHVRDHDRGPPLDDKLMKSLNAKANAILDNAAAPSPSESVSVEGERKEPSEIRAFIEDHFPEPQRVRERVADFLDEVDPFGDRFSEHERNTLRAPADADRQFLSPDEVRRIERDIKAIPDTPQSVPACPECSRPLDEHGECHTFSCSHRQLTPGEERHFTKSNRQTVKEPVYKAVERILDEESAWIARPSKEVTRRVALAATAAAHMIISQSDTTPDAPLSQGEIKRRAHEAADMIEALIADRDKLASQLSAYKTKGLDTAVRKQKLEELEAERDKLIEEVERLTHLGKKGLWKCTPEHTWAEWLDDRQNEIAKLVERVSVLTKALEEIAKQKNLGEIITEHGEDGVGDIEYAYDTIIQTARSALTRTSEGA